MNDRQVRFIKLLENIFELDKSDLDFGIYRIMNIRRAEIEKFFKEGLPKKINETLAPFAGADSATIRKRMAEIETSLGGVEVIAQMPAAVPMVAEYNDLKKKLAEGVDISALESDVYSALYSFFSRYYDDGDFISKRRYKEGVYAIPYEGEEVKLYWANQDQYYIKTSENFKDYTFKTNEADGITVHFRLVDATTEQNNNKEADDKKRTFMLYTETAENPELKTFEYDAEKKELIIRFIYDIPANTKTKWHEANMKAINAWIAEHPELIGELLRNVSTKSGEFLPIIEKHLKGYVAKNTFDYFIHKDLGGFLRRELDFFIKNEVMHIDDIDTETETRVEAYLGKVRAIKRVGAVIIDFLAQVEDFQKRLWLKKKFVVEANYCITLDKIDERYYKEIAANEAQVKEWIEMYAIDEIKADMHTFGFSLPLSVDFLKQNQNLIVDTCHFTQQFRDQLLASIDNLDEQTNGVMINADNSQAIRFILNKYQNSIQTTYIDPPYNTVYSQILYKNNYEHSSWLSLMNNTMPLLTRLWTKDFSFGLAIDDYEFVNLAKLVDSNFPSYERSVAVVNHHPQGAGGRLSRTHEYYILLSDSNSPQYLGEPLEDYQEDRSFMRSGTGDNNYRYGRWKSFYALLLDPHTRQIVDAEEAVPLDAPYPTEPTSDGLVRIYPINSKGEERVWRSSFKTGKERARNGELIISERGTVYQCIDHESKRATLFSNWTDTIYNAGTNGTDVLKHLGLGNQFDYPKSIYTLKTGLWAQTFGRDNGYILDFFAGSGTTGHAVVDINREFGGNRKYILVEMGEYFNKVTKPRIQKVVYASEWKDGKPKSRTTGVSHIMKYMRLESYEDALSNIELKKQGGYFALRRGLLN